MNRTRKSCGCCGSPLIFEGDLVFCSRESVVLPTVGILTPVPDEVRCHVEMRHADDVSVRCILDEHHLLHDADHVDEHGHRVAVLVHQATIREVSAWSKVPFPWEREQMPARRRYIEVTPTPRYVARDVAEISEAEDGTELERRIVVSFPRGTPVETVPDVIAALRGAYEAGREDERKS